MQDAHDLWAVRNDLSAHYVQANNIDLNIFVEGNGWEPIGQSGGCTVYRFIQR